MAERLTDIDLTFFSGMKSDSNPSQIPLSCYFLGTNVLNLGGTISCRPGYRCLVSFPAGNLQGGAIFRPQVGLEQMLVAIDGIIYVAPWPFLDFTAIPGILFSPHAQKIYWEMATQSASRLTADFASAIEVVPPRTVMFMQDGGDTAPAWYDGSAGGHIRGVPFETPAGSSMRWIGDRLWVASGNRVFASDIANPFSFREDVYLGGSTSFYFSSDVTALVITPSIQSPQLMVFTDANGSILQANIRDRSAWPSTVDFQKQVVQVGAESNRGVISHYGKIVYMAAQGVVMFDPASAGNVSSRLPVRDNEMLVSKRTLNENLTGVAMGAFGQFLMISVPAESLFNKHTWVLNHASMQSLNDESGPSWASVWIGTRPVEWMSGNIVGTERIFYVSNDEDGVNRLWEAFIPDRLDNFCPITWAVETRGYFGMTGSAQKAPGSRCRMGWADVGLAGIAEDLDLGIFYAPGVRGAYLPILNKQISVARGSLSHDEEITATSSLFAFKPQSRMERTEDANQQRVDLESGSCGIERSDNENIDESFQLLIVGHGPATICYIRAFAFTVPEDLSGEPNACVDEVPFNTIRFDGAGAKAPDRGDATAALELRPLAYYTANKTSVVHQSGFSEVGVGFAQSIVSQQAADRVAEIISIKQAEMTLRRNIPPTISAGLGFPSI